MLTGWWVLTFMWLKFAAIWRLFRLAALLDGVEAPENMPRCFANNHDVEVTSMSGDGFDTEDARANVFGLSSNPPLNYARSYSSQLSFRSLAARLQGFWKSWHSSFNLWLVQYLYVPLGGNRCRTLNIWPIFLFVALWHDLEVPGR